MITKNQNLKNGVAGIPLEKRVGCLKNSTRPGTLGKLDRMDWNEFNLLPHSEQKRLIKQDKSESKKFGGILGIDSNVRKELEGKVISVKTDIIKEKWESIPRFGYGFTKFDSDFVIGDTQEKTYKQISVALEIPGMNNGKPLTISGEKHTYKNLDLIATTSKNYSMLPLDFMGLPDCSAEQNYKHSYSEGNEKITHNYDFKEIFLTSVVVNGNILAGMMRKNTIRDFIKKLFGGSRHTIEHLIEIGCCAVAEKEGRLYLHYERLLARLPRNESA